MRINVNFLNEEIDKYRAGHDLMISVHWESNNQYFPMPIWSDFRCILGWWVSAIIELINGKNKCEFVFMDGPYRIQATYNQSTKEVLLEGKESDCKGKFQAKTTVEEIIEQLINAHSKIYEALVERGLNTGKEQEYFERIVELLQKARS
jgi:hypothetical protein